MSRRHWACVAFAALLTLWRGALVAQTPIVPPNGYTPQDDVEIGLQAAAVVERQLPVLHDEAVRRYLASVVRRLVAALPSELRHPEFHYSVQVLDVRELNAWALWSPHAITSTSTSRRSGGCCRRSRSSSEVAGSAHA